MTRRDRGVVAALSALLVTLAVLTGLPPGRSGTGAGPSPSSAGGSPEPSAGAPAILREGLVGRPSSINPLTARTQADRDLVALVFSGLVALGPNGTYRPDLAEGWTVDSKGKRWTFTIRADARWQDGEPVTSADVAYTVGVLQDPAYTGPLGASWRDVTATVVDDRTVTFDLATPIGGFLDAARVGLLPEHLLRDTPVATLADAPFSVQPVGSGPFALASWNAQTAVLVPTSFAEAPAVGPSDSPSPSTSPVPSASAIPGSPGPSASPAPSTSPAPSGSSTPVASGGRPLAGIELTFFADADTLAAAYRAGSLDMAAGLPPASARALAGSSGIRIVTYPRTTLSAVALNLRPGQSELRVPRVRRALLAAIDRARIIATVLDGVGTRADSPIPPSSWAFDKSASKPVKYDPKAAAAGLKAAGWKRLAGGWAVPGSKRPYTLELIAPETDSNPTAMAIAEAVAADWRAIGLNVTVAGLAPAVFVGDRLSTGKFAAAEIDVNVGLDPDLYPLFASTQVVAGGSNVTGIQDVELDRLLTAARAPGTLEQRRRASSALQARLADRQYVLPIVFRDEVIVASDRVLGPVPRELGDPSDRFWDVLTWRLADGR